MIDSQHIREVMDTYLRSFAEYDDPVFALKVRHTWHTAHTAEKIAVMIGCDEEDIQLAYAIGVLHDIGRFEEYRMHGEYNSLRYDHAKAGAEFLASGKLREFIAEEAYDTIILNAVNCHSMLALPAMEGKEKLHAMIIRDADKTDNLRIRAEEDMDLTLPVKLRGTMEPLTVSASVLDAVRHNRSVYTRDRVTAGDHLVCVMAFVYGLHLQETKKYILEKGYIEAIGRRYGKDSPVMEEITERITQYLKEGTV